MTVVLKLCAHKQSSGIINNTNNNKGMLVSKMIC